MRKWQDRVTANATILPQLAPSYYFSGSLGLTRNFDMGMTIEQQFGPVFEIFGKYALINSRNNGLSLAAYGGGYQGGGTRGHHIGPALSLKLGRFETYFVASYKGGAWEGEHTSVEDDDNVFKLKSGVYKIDFNYLQYSTGINLWFSQEFALNISAKRLYFYGTEADNSNDVVVPGWSLI